MTTLGKMISERRIQMNYTKAYVARQIFVAPQTIYNWENDRSSPSGPALVMLCDLLRVDLHIWAAVSETSRGYRKSGKKISREIAEDIIYHE